MRTKLVTIAAVAALSVLAPAGLALAHTTNPGNACNNDVPFEKNPNCEGSAQTSSFSSSDSNENEGDNDHDGDHGHHDNCPGVYNPNQVDTDKDGHGDPCDHKYDSDGDGDCDPFIDEVEPVQDCDGEKTYSDHDGDGTNDADEDTPPEDSPLPV